MTTMIKNCVRCLLLSVLLMPAAQAAAPLVLEDAVALAVADNPGLAARQSRAEALAAVPAQMATLPDPTLSLNALSYPTDTFSGTQEAMTQQQIGIGLTLPFPGKLDLREQAASSEAQAAGQDVAEQQLVLVRNVRTAWWSLFYLDRALDIVLHNQAWLRQLNVIAQSRYSTGQGMQSDVLLAQVELSRLLETEITLRAARRNTAARLNALLGRAAATPITLPQEVKEDLPPISDDNGLVDLAQENRPLLATRRKLLEAAQARTRLAEKDYYPDLKLGVAYGFRNGNNPNGSARADLASVTLGISLPLFADSRQDQAVAQRQAERQQQEYELQDSVWQVTAQIEQAQADYQSARKQVSLFKTGLIPQAQQTVSAMRAAYQVNQVDFLNLVRAQITLYNYETQYWKTLSSGWQALASLEAAVGTTLPAPKEKAQ
ncbi:MAG: TolC family protein [Sideroxydans sp.]|jgi:outer membrane protein TolC